MSINPSLSQNPQDNQSPRLTDHERARLDYMRGSGDDKWSWDFEGVYHDGQEVIHDFGNICILHQHIGELIAIIDRLTAAPEAPAPDPIPYVGARYSLIADNGYDTWVVLHTGVLDSAKHEILARRGINKEVTYTIHDHATGRNVPIDPTPAPAAEPTATRVLAARYTIYSHTAAVDWMIVYCTNSIDDAWKKWAEYRAKNPTVEFYIVDELLDKAVKDASPKDE